MVKLNLKKHLKNLAVRAKDEGKRRIDEYREERRERRKTERDIKTAEREEYLKARSEERNIRRMELIEEARERARLRALENYHYSREAHYRPSNTISERIQSGIETVRETQDRLGKIGSKMPTYKMLGKVNIQNVPKTVAIKSHKDSLSSYINPIQYSGSNMLNAADIALGVNKRRVGKNEPSR